MRWLAIFLAMSFAALAQDQRALFNRAVQSYKNARYAKAADAFEKVVALSPDDVPARLYFGRSFVVTISKR